MEEQEERVTRLSREEQEFNVEWVAAEQIAHISTTDPNMMARMDKLVAKRPDIFKLIREDGLSKSYQCPKKCCYPRAPRVVSEEQRQAAAERLAKAREAQA